MNPITLAGTVGSSTGAAAKVPAARCTPCGIIYRFVHNGEMCLKELKEGMPIDDSTLNIISTSSSMSDSSRNGSAPSVAKMASTPTIRQPCSVKSNVCCIARQSPPRSVARWSESNRNIVTNLAGVMIVVQYVQRRQRADSTTYLFVIEFPEMREQHDVCRRLDSTTYWCSHATPQKKCLQKKEWSC